MASQLSFAGFAWKNLWRRRLRTLLTLGGITMAIGAFVALVGFSRSFEHEWLRLYESAGTDIAVSEKSFLNTSLDESVGTKLRAVPVVERAVPMIFNLMDLTPEVNALVFGWPADSYELDSLNLRSGRRFRDGQVDEGWQQRLYDLLGMMKRHGRLSAAELASARTSKLVLRDLSQDVGPRGAH